MFLITRSPAVVLLELFCHWRRYALQQATFEFVSGSVIGFLPLSVDCCETY